MCTGDNNGISGGIIQITQSGCTHDETGSNAEGSQQLRQEKTRPILKEFGEGSLVEKLLAIQHCLNPLHVYCRFVDRGLGKGLSASLCKSYEILVFVWIRWTVKTVMYCFCVINRQYQVLEEVRKR